MVPVAIVNLLFVIVQEVVDAAAPDGVRVQVGAVKVYWIGKFSSKVMSWVKAAVLS